MCGRFTLTPKKLKEGLGDFPVVIRSDLEAAYDPSFNIAPSQEHPLVYFEKEFRLDFGRWGLIPTWSKDPNKSFINARAETALEKPTFRQPTRRSRCLVPADGFYEWAKREPGKQPFFFHLPDRKPFFFAGIYNVWSDPKKDQGRPTFSILTSEANDSMKAYHHRMPVILNKEYEQPWLRQSEEKIQPFLEKIMSSLKNLELEHREVSKYVNSPRNNDEKCLDPIGEAK